MRLHYITDEVLNSQSVETIHIDVVCRNLSAMGHSVSLFAPNSGEFEAKSYQVNFISTPRKAVSAFFQLKLFFRLRREIRVNRPDVIYIRNSQLLFMPTIISRMFKIPLVLEANGKILEEIRQVKYSFISRTLLAMRIYKFVESFNVRTAKKIIVVTEGIKGYFVKNYQTPSAKIEVVANGVDTEFFKPLDVREVRKRIGLDSPSPVLSFRNIQSLKLVRENDRGEVEKDWIPASARMTKRGERRNDITDNSCGYLISTENSRTEKLNDKNKLCGYQIPTETICVGYIGSFYSWQGLRYIAEAAKMVVGKRPDVKFLIVGNGDEKDYLTSFVKDNGLENFIEIRPAVSHSLVPLYINTLDICLCYPTKFRAGATSPFKVYEYLACGRAVILADIAGMREEFGDVVSYVEPESSSALAEKIISLIDDKGERERLGSLGRQFVEQGRSWKSVADKIAGICRRL